MTITDFDQGDDVEVFDPLEGDLVALQSGLEITQALINASTGNFIDFGGSNVLTFTNIEHFNGSGLPTANCTSIGLG